MNRWFAFGLSGHGERTAKYSLLGVKRTNFVAAHARRDLHLEQGF